MAKRRKGPGGGNPAKRSVVEDPCIRCGKESRKGTSVYGPNCIARGKRLARKAHLRGPDPEREAGAVEGMASALGVVG